MNNKTYHENLFSKINSEEATRFLEPLIEKREKLGMKPNLNRLTDELVLAHDISPLAARRMVESVMNMHRS